MSRNLGQRDSPIKRIAANQQGVRNEEQKPVLGGPQIFVGDYIGPGDPSNDPEYTSDSSPPWQNGFYYILGAPIWFAHGVDGETDMGGAYDLITGGPGGVPPVSGDVAFDMPLEWAEQAPPIHIFGVLIEEGATPEDDIYVVAAQVINQTTGTVRIYWPVGATPYP